MTYIIRQFIEDISKLYELTEQEKEKLYEMVDEDINKLYNEKINDEENGKKETGKTKKRKS